MESEKKTESIASCIFCVVEAVVDDGVGWRCLVVREAQVSSERVDEEKGKYVW